MKIGISHGFISAFVSVALFGGFSSDAQASVDVQVLSATIKDQKIEGAKVILQRNGEQSVAAISNSQGTASLQPTFTDDASTLLIIKKAGYSDLVVKCPCSGMSYAISAVMTTLDGIRIVLNWGHQPRDLDSHLLFPENQHVYFMAPYGSDALLDVDAKEGNGPETITITRKQNSRRYVYAVHDFSNRNSPTSNDLSRSGAKVFVYVGQTLVKTYYVPDNSPGNLWTVFAITENGEFQDINSIRNLKYDIHSGASDFSSVLVQPVTSVAATQSAGNEQDQAKVLNKQGEDAYHAGNLDDSIRLYQAAIELDGNFGQAYSNLGLSFQKTGRVAEAMWANRKAIALANGPTAATVRASSHFNNGKIYEAAEQWADALREYQQAKSEKANPVYDKAIQRMQQKMGQ